MTSRDLALLWKDRSLSHVILVSFMLGLTTSGLQVVTEACIFVLLQLIGLWGCLRSADWMEVQFGRTFRPL